MSAASSTPAAPAADASKKVAAPKKVSKKAAADAPKKAAAASSKKVAAASSKKAAASKEGAAKPAQGKKGQSKNKVKRVKDHFKKPKPGSIPETALFRRKLQLRNRNYKVALKKKEQKRDVLRNKLAYRRAARYMREYLDQEQNLQYERKKALKDGLIFVPPEPKLAFVIRIRGILGISPKPRKILQLFRLRQINNGVFLRLNDSTKKMLTLIEPYIAWGYPDLSTIRKLVYARGFVKRQRQRVPLNDNRLVEEQLGKYGLVCVEDIVNQLKTVGPYFSKVNKFLWNFKLHTPRGGWRRIRLHYCEGGDAGNREELINKLIVRMI